MRRNPKCPGLRLKGGLWWIDIDSRRYGRIYESTGCSEDQREFAEAYYRKRIDRALAERVLGVRKRHIFREAATKHLQEIAGKLKSADLDAWALQRADKYIGDLELSLVCDETLEPMKRAMALEGRKGKTINLALQVVRKILNKAARRWREDGKTWLEAAPLITMESTADSREPYPLSWDEERKLLLPELPAHLEGPAMFCVNVGPREQEIVALRWAWERRIPELDSDGFRAMAFILPKEFNKNGRERLLLLNRTAQGVIDKQRGKHDEFVFTYEGKPLGGLYNKAWQKARSRAAKKYREVLNMECPTGFATLHFHDLRHTFGRRLRAAGVSNETRADLLGHAKGKDVTTHYSAGELKELLDAVRKIEVPMGSAPTLTVLRAA